MFSNIEHFFSVFSLLLSKATPQDARLHPLKTEVTVVCCSGYRQLSVSVQLFLQSGFELFSHNFLLIKQLSAVSLVKCPPLSCTFWLTKNSPVQRGTFCQNQKSAEYFCWVHSVVRVKPGWRQMPIHQEESFRFYYFAICSAIYMQKDFFLILCPFFNLYSTHTKYRACKRQSSVSVN